MPHSSFFVALGPPFKCHTYSQKRPLLLLAATFSHTAPRTHALTQKKEEMCFLLLFSLHAEQEIPSTVTNATGAARGHSEEKKKSRISLSRKYYFPFKYFIKILLNDIKGNFTSLSWGGNCLAHFRQPCLQLATQNRNNISGTISNACPTRAETKARET